MQTAFTRKILVRERQTRQKLQRIVQWLITATKADYFYHLALLRADYSDNSAER